MAHYFTKAELFRLRNEIKMQFVIKSLLNIPTKEHEGITRFLCPKCEEFQTGINPNTNLARCFRCEENFNPIDLVIAQRKIGFTQAVRFLQEASQGQNQPAQARTQSNQPPARSNSNPVSTRDILAAVQMGVKQRNT